MQFDLFFLVIVIFCENIVLTIVPKYYYKQLQKIVIIINAFVFAMRSMDIPDTRNYYQFYEDFDWENSYFEMANVIFIFIFKAFGLNARIYFFVTIILNEVIILYAINLIFCQLKIPNKYKELNQNKIVVVLDNNKLLMMSLVMYWSYFGFLYNAVILRQGIALTFLFLSIAYGLDNRQKESLLSAFVAVMFHKAAIAYLIIYLCIKKVYKDCFYYIAYLLILIAWTNDFSYYFFNIFIDIVLYFNKKFTFLHQSAYYIVTNVVLRSGGQKSWKDIIFLFIGFILITFIRDNNDTYKKLINIYMCGCLFMVGLNNLVVAYRWYDCFLFVAIPLFSFCISSVIRNAWVKKIAFSGINILLLIIACRYLLSVMTR